MYASILSQCQFLQILYIQWSVGHDFINIIAKEVIIFLEFFMFFIIILELSSKFIIKFVISKSCA